MTMHRPGGSTRNPAGFSQSAELQAKWSWFLALGLVAVAAGLVALAVTEFTTLVSIVTIGAMMVLVGGVEIVLGFRARSWNRALSWELSGLFYVAAGIFAWAEPVRASLVLTLLLGAGLVATGLVRGVAGLRHHDRTRAPLILSGAVTALLGLVIVSGWPANSLFVIGLLLGMELVFTGVNWIFFALRLRPHA